MTTARDMLERAKRSIIYLSEQNFATHGGSAKTEARNAVIEIDRFLAQPEPAAAASVTKQEHAHGFPCGLCGAKDFEDAGNKCHGGDCPGTNMSSEVFAEVKPAAAAEVTDAMVIRARQAYIEVTSAAGGSCDHNTFQQAMRAALEAALGERNPLALLREIRTKCKAKEDTREIIAAVIDAALGGGEGT